MAGSVGSFLNQARQLAVMARLAGGDVGQGVSDILLLGGESVVVTTLDLIEGGQGRDTGGRRRLSTDRLGLVNGRGRVRAVNGGGASRDKDWGSGSLETSGGFDRS